MSIASSATAKASQDFNAWIDQVVEVRYQCSDVDTTAVVIGPLLKEQTYATIKSGFYRSDGLWYRVVAVADNAFKGCTDLKEVIIPNTVTSIGNDAFSGCSSLSKLSLDSIRSIGVNAFRNCKSLKSVTIPNSVTTIGAYAFAGCGLEYIALPDSIETIDEGVLAWCKYLKDAYIGKKVISIGDHAFEGCLSLNNGTLLSGTKVTSIGYRAFASSGLRGLWMKRPLKIIGDEAFLSCEGMYDVYLPSSVVFIGDRAFGNTYLNEINIPDSVTHIGKEVFLGCRNLIKIDVSTGNLNYSSIEGVLYTKDKTRLICCPAGKRKIKICDSVTTIDDWACYECDFETVTIPSFVTSIGESAFDGGGLGFKEVYCQAKVPPIAAEDAFYAPGAKSLYVPDGSEKLYEVADVWKDFGKINNVPTAVDSVIVDDFDVKIVDGCICVGGEAPICVYDMQGRMVYYGNPTTIINLSSGLYIVVCERKSVKVMVP